MGAAITPVALRKESVDRNNRYINRHLLQHVALRKESVDRNCVGVTVLGIQHVALRKESVDRNALGGLGGAAPQGSLSARRAWIEIAVGR